MQQYTIQHILQCHLSSLYYHAKHMYIQIKRNVQCDIKMMQTEPVRKMPTTLALKLLVNFIKINKSEKKNQRIISMINMLCLTNAQFFCLREQHL